MSEIVLWYDTIENGMIKNNLEHLYEGDFPFIKKYVSLPATLHHNAIDFVVNSTVNNSENFYKKYSNAKNFYPIELGTYTSLIEQICIEKSHFFKNINVDTEILIWFDSEGFYIKHSNDSLNFLFNQIHTRYPLNKITFIFGDHIRPKNIPDYINYRCFKNAIWFTTIKYNIKKIELNLKKKSQYDFINLNRRFRESRYMVFNDLKNSGMLNNAFYTNHWSGKEDMTLRISQFVKNSSGSDAIFCNKICTDEFMKEINNINTTDQGFKLDLSLKDLDLSDISYLELVNETHFTSCSNLFISEKTFRAIALGHIFLICGQPGTLSHLKNQGFQTFDDLFDESYDNIASFAERWYIIKKNLQLWIDMSANDKKEYYEKSFDKLVYNQNLLYDRDFKTEIYELFEDTQMHIKGN